MSECICSQKCVLGFGLNYSFGVKQVKIMAQFDGHFHLKWLQKLSIPRSTSNESRLGKVMVKVNLEVFYIRCLTRERETLQLYSPFENVPKVFRRHVLIKFLLKRG